MGEELPKDLMKDLASRLGAGSTIEDAKLVFDQAVQLFTQGNPEFKNKFLEARRLFEGLSEKYESQSQFRTAAESNFYIALTYHYLNDPTARDEIFQHVTQQLIKTGDYYFSQGEGLKAAAPYALAILVQIVLGNLDQAKQYYHAYLPKYESDYSLNQGKEALYGVGHLIIAIEQTKNENFMLAQDTFGTHLRPLLTNSRLDRFGNVLIDMALQIAKDKIQENIRLPKPFVQVSPPIDPLFNEPFTLRLVVKNQGEGSANNLSLVLNVPDDLEILGGQPSITVAEMLPNQEVTLELTLRYQEAVKEEATVKITGSYTYNDMLGTQHSIDISPIEFTVRSTSLKQELERGIKALQDKLQAFASDPNVLADEVQPKFLEFIKVPVTFLEEQFSKGELGFAQQFMDYTSNFINLVRETFYDNNVRTAITERREAEIQERIRSEVGKVKEELETKFTKELEAKDKEYQEEISKLKEQHELELQRLKQDYEKSLEDVKIKAQIQLERSLKNLEEELTSRHREELQKIRDNSETVIQELNRELETVKQETEARMRREFEETLNKKIQDLQEQHQHELEQAKRTVQLQGETDMKTLESKLLARFEEEKEALRRKYQEEFDRKAEALKESLLQKSATELAMKLREQEEKYQKEIEEYKQTIQTLREALSSYKQS